MIKIEKGIPIPPAINGAETRYLFGKMKVGDSFFIPNVKKGFSIYSCVRNYNEKHAARIKVAQRRENNGVRVWRIE